METIKVSGKDEDRILLWGESKGSFEGENFSNGIPETINKDKSILRSGNASIGWKSTILKLE
jgi:hypothetical protein